MSFLIVMFKELLETLVRRWRLIRIGNKNDDTNKQLKESGIAVQPGFYSDEECKKLREKIDGYINSENINVWKDELGADNRIYFINEIDSTFERFYTHPKIRSALAAYTGTTKPSGMLLAARIDAKTGNLGSGGGWHRDSPVTHQFKAICYLSDVEVNNGPFQYIKRSHCKLNIIKAYLAGVFKAGQYRFSREDIEKYLVSTNSSITDLTARQGTLVFSDTKGLHRGKPILEGSRYVLFCYFWHGEIPSHFKKFKQKKHA